MQKVKVYQQPTQTKFEVLQEAELLRIDKESISIKIVKV